MRHLKARHFSKKHFEELSPYFIYNHGDLNTCLYYHIEAILRLYIYKALYD